MSTYVIGDIQGCLEPLEALLTKVDFNPDADTLWCVGDLINRGPDNAGVLDLLMSLPNMISVLGNHDLHFLAIALGKQKRHRSDTITDLLDHPKLSEYIEFLRQLPLLHYDETQKVVMVHAGMPPQLALADCLMMASEVEQVLRSTSFTDFLEAMYGNEPAIWQDELTGMVRLRVITNYFTRLRYCTAAGEMELTHKADVQPDGYAPWFTFNREDDLHVLFGHWAALNGIAESNFVTALDTGCVWGRELTALRLEDRKLFAYIAG